MKTGVRYAVFSVRRNKSGSTWTRSGWAFVNKDGSVNVYLDVLPLDGVLHIREAANQGLAVITEKTSDRDHERDHELDEEIPF